MTKQPPKLYVVMVGLPARGKSTIAQKLRENLAKDGIKTRIFNNGALRRQLIHRDTSTAAFYDPNNQENVDLREHIADINMEHARKFLANSGHVAILDATNVCADRRRKIIKAFREHPTLFIECINNNEDILNTSILTKIRLPEFDHLEMEKAIASFKQRIRYYESIYSPLSDEPNFVKLDSLNNRILVEEVNGDLPYYDRLRDFLVTDSVKNLFLIRHGETYFNLENRIGGDSHLTEKGWAQAHKLGEYFKTRKIPVVFTSQKTRTIQTGEPIRERQKECMIIPLTEFNEIDSGVCEDMTYKEIRQQMPDIYYARRADKYNYVYPEGEGYATMKERINRGIKKALYLGSNVSNIMIIGHQAVNRMILSHFLYRREEDVPYIFIPQDKFYHIVAVQDKKLFQLKRF